MFEDCSDDEGDYSYQTSHIFKKKEEIPLKLWAEHFKKLEKGRNLSMNLLFEKEFIRMKGMYCFLPESQVLGKTLTKFGIPNVCGKISKKFLQSKKSTSKTTSFEKVNKKYSAKYLGPTRKNTVKSSSEKRKFYQDNLVPRYPPVVERWSHAALRKFKENDDKEISSKEAYSFVNENNEEKEHNRIDKNHLKQHEYNSGKGTEQFTNCTSPRLESEQMNDPIKSSKNKVIVKAVTYDKSNSEENIDFKRNSENQPAIALINKLKCDNVPQKSGLNLKLNVKKTVRFNDNDLCTFAPTQDSSQNFQKEEKSQSEKILDEFINNSVVATPQKIKILQKEQQITETVIVLNNIQEHTEKNKQPFMQDIKITPPVLSDLKSNILEANMQNVNRKENINEGSSFEIEPYSENSFVIEESSSSASSVMCYKNRNLKNKIYTTNSDPSLNKLAEHKMLPMKTQKEKKIDVDSTAFNKTITNKLNSLKGINGPVFNGSQTTQNYCEKTVIEETPSTTEETSDKIEDNAFCVVNLENKDNQELLSGDNQQKSNGKLYDVSNLISFPERLPNEFSDEEYCVISDQESSRGFSPDSKNIEKTQNSLSVNMSSNVALNTNDVEVSEVSKSAVRESHDNFPNIFIMDHSSSNILDQFKECSPSNSLSDREYISNSSTYEDEEESKPSQTISARTTKSNNSGKITETNFPILSLQTDNELNVDTYSHLGEKTNSVVHVQVNNPNYKSRFYEVNRDSNVKKSPVDGGISTKTSNELVTPLDRLTSQEQALENKNKNLKLSSAPFKVEKMVIHSPTTDESKLIPEQQTFKKNSNKFNLRKALFPIKNSVLPKSSTISDLDERNTYPKQKYCLVGSTQPFKIPKEQKENRLKLTTKNKAAMDTFEGEYLENGQAVPLMTSSEVERAKITCNNKNLEENHIIHINISPPHETERGESFEFYPLTPEQLSGCVKPLNNDTNEFDSRENEHQSHESLNHIHSSIKNRNEKSQVSSSEVILVALPSENNTKISDTPESECYPPTPELQSGGIKFLGNDTSSQKSQDNKISYFFSNRKKDNFVIENGNMTLQRNSEKPVVNILSPNNNMEKNYLTESEHYRPALEAIHCNERSSDINTNKRDSLENKRCSKKDNIETLGANNSLEARSVSEKNLSLKISVSQSKHSSGFIPINFGKSSTNISVDNTSRKLVPEDNLRNTSMKEQCNNVDTTKNNLTLNKDNEYDAYTPMSPESQEENMQMFTRTESDLKSLQIQESTNHTQVNKVMTLNENETSLGTKYSQIEEAHNLGRSTSTNKNLTNNAYKHLKATSGMKIEIRNKNSKLTSRDQSLGKGESLTNQPPEIGHLNKIENINSQKINVFSEPKHLELEIDLNSKFCNNLKKKCIHLQKQNTNEPIVPITYPENTLHSYEENEEFNEPKESENTPNSTNKNQMNKIIIMTGGFERTPDTNVQNLEMEMEQKLQDITKETITSNLKESDQKVSKKLQEPKKMFAKSEGVILNGSFSVYPTLEKGSLNRKCEERISLNSLEHAVEVMNATITSKSDYFQCSKPLTKKGNNDLIVKTSPIIISRNIDPRKQMTSLKMKDATEPHKIANKTFATTQDTFSINKSLSDVSPVAIDTNPQGLKSIQNFPHKIANKTFATTQATLSINKSLSDVSPVAIDTNPQGLKSSQNFQSTNNQTGKRFEQTGNLQVLSNTTFSSPLGKRQSKLFTSLPINTFKVEKVDKKDSLLNDNRLKNWISSNISNDIQKEETLNSGRHSIKYATTSNRPIFTQIDKGNERTSSSPDESPYKISQQGKGFYKSINNPLYVKGNYLQILSKKCGLASSEDESSNISNLSNEKDIFSPDMISPNGSFPSIDVYKNNSKMFQNSNLSEDKTECSRKKRKSLAYSCHQMPESEYGEDSRRKLKLRNLTYSGELKEPRKQNQNTFSDIGVSSNIDWGITKKIEQYLSSENSQTDGESRFCFKALKPVNSNNVLNDIGSPEDLTTFMEESNHSSTLKSDSAFPSLDGDFGYDAYSPCSEKSNKSDDCLPAMFEDDDSTLRSLSDMESDSDFDLDSFKVLS